MIRVNETVDYDKQYAIEGLEVHDVSYTLVRKSWIHRDRFLFFDELIYLKKGTLYLRVNDVSYTVHAGHCFLIHRYAGICGERASDELCEFYTVSFQSDLQSFRDLYLRELPVEKSEMFVDEIFRRLYDSAAPSAQNPDKCGILMVVLTYELETINRIPKAERPLITETLEYINANLHTPLTVDSVCAYLNYNRDYLSRQFRADQGITIKCYIDNRRLSIAKQLLLTSKMPYAKIALELGFENAGQFYRFFKYHASMSPSEYRARNR